MLLNKLPLPLKKLAVTVLPKALTPDNTYLGVLPMETLLLDPVK